MNRFIMSRISKSMERLGFYRDLSIDLRSKHKFFGHGVVIYFIMQSLLEKRSFRLSVHPLVCSFVRDSVPFVELLRSFTLKFLSGVYLTNHSSESIHIWTIGTLEGRLLFHGS